MGKLGIVEAAIKHDVEAIARTNEALSKSFLAATALRIAKAMDDENLGPREIANLSRELRETMEELRGLVPKEEGERRTRLDELGAARARRRAAAR